LFTFCCSISQDRLTALLKWYKAEGLVLKEKRAGGRKGSMKSLSMAHIQNVVQGLTSYAAVQSMVLPGRVPGFKRDDVKLLPSSHTKIKVYNHYKDSLSTTGRIFIIINNYK